MTDPTVPPIDVARVVADERPAEAPIVTALEAGGVAVLASTATSTQVANPARTTWRSALQLAVAIATALPQIVPLVLGTWDPEWLVTALGQVLVVQTLLTRLMALPSVDAWLQEHLPAIASLRTEQAAIR